MPGLLATGELPKMSRSPGRKPGKWRGHEEEATELLALAARERNPEKRWGKVAESLSSTKSQSIASAIKKGEAVGFERTKKGHFEASTRKTPDRPEDEPILYDVWARWMPSR